MTTWGFIESPKTCHSGLDPESRNRLLIKKILKQVQDDKIGK